ncbi:DUF1330 domain-containing protein [Bradyrhizobium jicamae]|uniref:DUF1330 domain-containing protein n=1 Tax=Bradyrhizobium jicamae TaxID=280332 RepID=A0ABS5FUA6_9BRAD|nr:DUF1330 domain-containing protein [Bradyrhizobium jicamae]MBR0800320.1 DUF1330 domain-containing protein [Bradyrhizobium jicamae]
MTKGYWVGLVDVSDLETYKAYVRENAIAFKKYDARFLIRGGKVEKVEGAPRSRVVVIEFPSCQTALECYRSPEYQKAKALRDNVSTADLVVVEGYDGLQPGQGS